MGSNQAKEPEEARVRVQADLVPRIQRFIENHHRGSFPAACNALLLRGLNALEADQDPGRAGNSAA